ncbi:glutathione peroxidase [Aestuariimicrobium ganziense]|uniref:glutathione peroxidase n=1 Tax=Aestuariimicrobium ganziense TaxID=2773677 RepID=UPI001945139A|nr:glutathione peroxidase [Aestuariimicrobium ganziense]
MTTLHDFHAEALIGGDIDLADHAGRVVLVVNTASKCGLTPQYEGLEALWRDLGDDGLVVLGFPCDQFGHQEPGDAAEIEQFCTRNYGVSFPMFAKVEVNGDEAHPLFAWLNAERPGPDGEDIEWNFAKFLIDRDGTVVERFSPMVTPEELRPAVEALLGHDQ